LGLISGTSEDVYNYDIHRNVGLCDIFIGDCTYPSTGLGWELGTAVEKRKIPVLAIAHVSSKVTRLVKGAECTKNPQYHFKTYERLEEIIDEVRKMVSSLFALRGE